MTVNTTYQIQKERLCYVIMILKQAAIFSNVFDLYSLSTAAFHIIALFLYYNRVQVKMKVEKDTFSGQRNGQMYFMLISNIQYI